MLDVVITIFPAQGALPSSQRATGHYLGRWIRAEGAIYLHKVHGSLNWRSSSDKDRLTGLESLEVRHSNALPEDDQLVLIYPTSAKEGDTLAYPYSALIHRPGVGIPARLGKRSAP